MGERGPEFFYGPDVAAGYIRDLAAGFGEISSDADARQGEQEPYVMRPEATAEEGPFGSEVQQTLDILETYEKIQEVLSWLVESGANAPLLKGVKRGQLQKLLQQLGIDPSDPEALLQLEGLKREISDSVLDPKPVLEVPSIDFFETRISQIVGERKRSFIRPPSDLIVGEQVRLVDVVRHGQTEWKEIKSRTVERSIAQWTRGIAAIMADPVAYMGEFAGLATSSYPDHMAIDRQWNIQNGRHRSLAARCLGEEYINALGMERWVTVVVDE